MKNFNKIQTQVERIINLHLDVKVKYKLTVDHHDEKFWRNRMLIPIHTWDRINKKPDLKYSLKYMPEKFMRKPLPYEFINHPEDYSKHTIWLMDYFEYLLDICKEPEEGIFDRVMK